MKVVDEIRLCEFEFWSGARSFARMLTLEEFDIIERWFECDSDGHSATVINDMFWFESDFIVTEILGYPDAEEFYNERSAEE